MCRCTTLASVKKRIDLKRCVFYVLPETEVRPYSNSVCVCKCVSVCPSIRERINLDERVRSSSLPFDTHMLRAR